MSDIQFIRKIAKQIYDRGLITPAVFFLEMTKPLALIGSHALVFLGPIVTAFINQESYYQATKIFEEPKNVELLIQELEKLEHTHSMRTVDER